MADVEWTRDALGAAIKSAAGAHGVKAPQVMMALRALVTGQSQTPAIDAVLALLGRETTLARWKAGIDTIARCAAGVAVARDADGSGKIRNFRGLPNDQVRLRDRRRRVLAGEGHRRRVPGRDPRVARRPRHQSQARPLHQRRPRHDVAVPARRGVRHRRRRRDRPRPRPLRALHRRADGEAQQLHHRPDLRERDPQGAPRRLPRRHRAGHPAHHRRDQGLDPDGRRRCRGRRRRGRRHRRRHRVAAVPGGDPPARHHAGPRQRLLHPPDAGAVHPDGRRDEDQADAALGEGAARDRHPARRRAVPRRPARCPTATGARSRCSPTCPPKRSSRRSTPTRSTRFPRRCTPRASTSSSARSSRSIRRRQTSRRGKSSSTRSSIRTKPSPSRWSASTST